MFFSGHGGLPFDVSLIVLLTRKRVKLKRWANEGDLDRFRQDRSHAEVAPTRVTSILVDTQVADFIGFDRIEGCVFRLNRVPFEGLPSQPIFPGERHARRRGQPSARQAQNRTFARSRHQYQEFRELTAELARLLTYEACRDFELERCVIQGWAGPVEIDQIKGKKVSVVPILRAGLGMLDGVLDLIPSAKVSVVGIARNHETLMPEPYFERFVGQLDERMALIVDPMLATGGSLIATIDMLKRNGCKARSRAGAGRGAGRHQGSAGRASRR